MIDKRKLTIGLFQWVVIPPLFAYLALRYCWGLQLQHLWLWIGLHLIQSYIQLKLIFLKDIKYKKKECGCDKDSICSSCNPEEFYKEP